MKLFDFIGGALSDKGEPSSKRLAAFIVLSFTLIVEAWKGMEYDTLITFLGFVVVSLGISGLEKFTRNGNIRKEG